jgi:hypothetical protein
VSFLTGEARSEKRGDDLHRERRADDARSQTEHVHVVVLDGLMRRICVVTDSGPDTGKLVCSDRNPCAAPAHDDASLDLSVSQYLGDRLG